ncbi:anhydro-N-acetylmuramic acid kinase [Undibacterium oligocarboniphilum]|uniref:Anhydro-N-acetylmuramic acid kinase n=1 Tax=Undibacterium oligocarboniphilum TaxID=666702 RepID=A0A850QJP8_9BURK|nr:anhydro-N-acetylmuramic acid kinase [Undibacterium oligocarboniphilum]MBC3869986.1 anhydro-N-acetylmuramic acid kinase [Undibacterium oligocarboniphilum]NVO77603.1 anhydro-N-acetylmuramic acid kinase [Undibacterium oligocarboniphilum]
MRYENQELYIGLMSGTSLDGVDGVLVCLPASPAAPIALLASAYVPFDETFRADALSLQQPGNNEIHLEALLANRLAAVYAECVSVLLAQSGPVTVSAIGAHGQTIRHRPELGYTRQTNNPALLAELTGISVVADFRSRDVAAGGQGAPLVPAFHRAIFGAAGETRVVANIGGISNISVLAADGSTHGFDTGPGNVLMDFWMQRQQGAAYDRGGAWATQGRVSEALLDRLMQEPYLALPAPKSTGRDLFHADWLLSHLRSFPDLAAVDVQASLCAYTARTLAQAITVDGKDVSAVYVCGGGAYNAQLMSLLRSELQATQKQITIESTASLGIAPEQVEALAFAWLAQQFCLRQPGNLAAVTGARGPRILGALYPA